MEIKFNAIATVFKQQPQSVTTAELLKFFNANAEAFGEKPTKRFSDRKNAERRVNKLLSAIDEAAKSAKEEPVVGDYTHCPNCGIHLENGYTTDEDQKVEGLSGHEEFQYCCLGCGEEFGPVIPERADIDQARSEGVKRSWFNEEVKIKRSTRHAVKVKGRDGKEMHFRSVRQAFAELGLPLSKHIRFRMALKEEGQLNEYGYSWEVTEA